MGQSRSFAIHLSPVTLAVLLSFNFFAEKSAQAQKPA